MVDDILGDCSDLGLTLLEAMRLGLWRAWRSAVYKSSPARGDFVVVVRAPMDGWRNVLENSTFEAQTKVKAKASVFRSQYDE